jgi:hypothetical protein
MIKHKMKKQEPIYVCECGYPGTYEDVAKHIRLSNNNPVDKEGK